MWLIVGGDSQVGRAALGHLGSCGHRVASTTRRLERVGLGTSFLDLSRPPDEWEVPPGVTAACICAAVARLADCAADPVASAVVNVEHTIELAERLGSAGTHVLFLSSNQVFDGTMPHVRAHAATNPVSEYGSQKARTEKALCKLMAGGAPIAILRLAKVLDERTGVLADWCAELIRGRQIRTFTDMHLAPVPSLTVAAAIRAIMDGRATGIFQLSGPRDISYAGLGEMLARRLGADPRLVDKASSRDAGLPAGASPPHTTMDSSALEEGYGLVVEDVEQQVADFVGRCLRVD